MKKFILDGNKINSLEDFGIQLSGLASDSETEERDEYLVSKQDYENYINLSQTAEYAYYGHIDRINDWLGQLASQDDAFLLITNSNNIKEAFGYEALVSIINERLIKQKQAYPKDTAAHDRLERELRLASNCGGPTLFDVLDLKTQRSASGNLLNVELA